MKILLATENAGKVQEIRALLAERRVPIELFSIADLDSQIREKYRAEETGSTYAENALIKARALAQLAEGIVLAEDSGFEVEALGNAPGVYSARYAENDKARCEKVLSALKGVPEQKRGARFVACVVMLENGKNPIYFFGRRTGRVAMARLGEMGFGYDPIFIPDGEAQTWGETPTEKKILESHRGIAIGLAIDYLVVRLSQKST